MTGFIPSGYADLLPQPEEPIPSGFNAMGRPITLDRRSNALNAVRDMAPALTTEAAMNLIEAVARQLERDQPYEAMKAARGVLDITGSYRLMSTLLASRVRDRV